MNELGVLCYLGTLKADHRYQCLIYVAVAEVVRWDFEPVSEQEELELHVDKLWLPCAMAAVVVVWVRVYEQRMLLCYAVVLYFQHSYLRLQSVALYADWYCESPDKAWVVPEGALARQLLLSSRCLPCSASPRMAHLGCLHGNGEAVEVQGLVTLNRLNALHFRRRY